VPDAMAVEPTGVPVPGAIAVALSGVSKVYAAGTARAFRAVDGVSLMVRAGEILLVAGPNGSGKTTLLTLIGCMAQPTEGTITLFDANVTAFTQAALTDFRLRHVGFIFQTFRLIDSLTVFENVALLPRLSGLDAPSASKKAMDALGTVGMEARHRLMPWGLSSGEKQRVAIARAIVNDPPLLLADEPTGSLDSKGGQAAIDLLCSIARERGRTVVIVSHDERIRYAAHRVLLMEDGRIRDGG
jgi:putative ABC transport system ATP-binding protein